MAQVLAYSDLFYHQFEPKLKNRFVMKFDGIPSFIVSKISRPTITFSVVTIPHINVKRKIKGRGEWGDVTCTLYDPIVPSGAQAVMEWIRLSHESITGRDGYAEFYKRDVEFQVLGPVGDVVEEWKLVGAFISSANFGDVDWASDADPVTIELILAYDYAILQF